MEAAELSQQQQQSLWLEGRCGLYTVTDALSFMNEVSVAARYGAVANLAIASMYRATQCQVSLPEDESAAHARAFELTNGLLATGKVVEINLIASRLCLAYDRILPAIYALRRGHREPVLSDSAQDALDFITANAFATSGDIRRLLRAEGQRRPDAADLALMELQRELLVDRGPSAGQSKGVFYLTREGYPYRVFATAHPEIVSSAHALSRQNAAAELLGMYLVAARFATRRNLLKLFHLLVTSDEIDDTIQIFAGSRRARLVRLGRNELIVHDGD